MSAREPLDAARLAEFTALEAAATPGPWDSYPADGDGVTVGADRRFALRAREMVPALLAEVGRLAVLLAEARDAAVVPPEQILHRTELVVRTMLTQRTTPAEIAQALADAGLLTRRVRPAHELVPGDGVR